MMAFYHSVMPSMLAQRLNMVIWLCAAASAETSLPPGSEPTLSEYFGLGSEGGKPSPVRRVANLSSLEFERLARSGVPFVVTDAGRDLPMREWSCEYMQRTFGDVRFRREYGSGEANREVFRDDWTRQKVPIKGRKLPAGAPKYAPFYSDIVKARQEEPERKWGKKKAAVAMEKAIIDATKAPYFMDKANLPEMKRNPEFWLQPPETGSLAHMDEHCIPTIATTLSGVKRWRLASIPEKPHPEGYFDGLVYQRDEWDPMFEFETRPGESVIFPPGMIHEGLSVGDDCVSSITYQFLMPAPVAYWRSFFPRVRRTPDMRSCIPFIAQMATLGDTQYTPRAYKEAFEDGKSLGARLDRNSDGSISVEEIAPRFKGQRKSQTSVDIALDAHHYHDINGDGTTTVEEFADSFARWSDVELRARKDGVTLRDPDEAHASEL